MSRGRVAIDLDEVLGQFIPQLCKFYNGNASKFPFAAAQELSPSDFFSYQFCRVWGGTDAQSVEIVEAFLRDPLFTEGIPVVPGAVAGTKALKAAGYELVLVTSRQLIIEDITRAWVATHFPHCFASLSFGNHWGRDGRKVSKAEMCRELGAAVLVDDAVNYAKDCAEAGIRTLLFGNYPWNKTDEDFDVPESLITRVSSWDDVVTHLVERGR